MDRKLEAGRVYEKFQPSIEWAREPTSDTLILPLPGFQKEQLKVQVTASNKLRISGERHLGDSKWSSFRMELQIPSNYNSNGISAKFEGGKLLIKHPKIITPASYDQPADEKPKAQPQPQPQAVTEAPKPESDYSQAQERVQATQQVNPPSAAINGPEKSGKDYPPNTGVEKQASSKVNNEEAKAPAAQKSEDLAEEGKSPSGANATMEKVKKVDEAAASAVEAGKEAALSSNSNDQRDLTKFRTEDLKQAFSSLVMELKQRKKFMKLTLAVLLVLLGYFYAKSAIGYIGKSKI